MSNDDNNYHLEFNPVITISPDDFFVTVDLSELKQKIDIPTNDFPLMETFENRTPGDFTALFSFYQQIRQIIEETNKKNSTVIPEQPNIPKPLFFICRKHLFWATVDVDSQSGMLSTTSMRIHIPYEMYGYKKNNSGKYDLKHPISHSLPKWQSFANNTGNDKRKGYEVIEIFISESDDAIDKYMNRAETSCRWCGNPVPGTKGKPIKHHNEYCPGETLPDGHKKPSVCKSSADTFLRQFKPLMEEWKEYLECVASGNMGRADSIKEKSKYKYLLDDKVRFEYIMLFRDVFPLIKIKQLLRPMVNSNTLEPADFDPNEYESWQILPCCPVCGNLIPETKSIHSKYCSDKCRFKAHNDMKKSGKNR